MKHPTDSILIEEGNSTDYLVLPLAGGVLAQFVLAFDGLNTQEGELEGVPEILRDDARLVMEECSEDQDHLWIHDATRYGRVRDLALKAWAMVPCWMPEMYAAWKCRVARGVSRDAAVVQWLRGTASTPLVDL